MAPGKGDWVAASPPSESPPASGTDFAAFGAVEVRPLSRIQVIVSQRLTQLPFDQMTGGSFTISALGAIGGTAFTPIINSPEVAILGISRSYRKGFEAGTAVNWHSMLPISLSYDHRVINGADAGRFCVALATALDRPDKL